MTKIFNKIASLTLLISMVMLSACGDKADFFSALTPADGARLKFFHAASDAPGVNIVVNDKQLSGINTTPPNAPALLAYGASFPVSTTAGEYAVVPAGTASIKVVVPTTNAPDVTAVAASLPVENGKFYSIFATGTAPTYGAVVLNDVFDTPDPKKAYFRFVNVLGASATTGYDVWVNGVVVGKGITSTSTSAPWAVVDPIVYSGAAVTVVVRPAGSASTATALASGTIQPYAGRFYTVVMRGVIGGTGTKVPAITIAVNK
jgi:Domain of unknown function (DUF4397)